MHRRLITAVCLALVATALTWGAAAAQWPTTCVELNDIVEAHLGNDNNVGIYQRVFGDQAEQACRNDHLADVRATFGWAVGGDEPATAPAPPSTASPASGVWLPDTGLWLSNLSGTAITVHAVEAHTRGAVSDDGATLTVGCYGDGEVWASVRFNGFVSAFDDSRTGETWDASTTVYRPWWVSDDSDTVFPRNADRFIRTLREARTFEVFYGDADFGGTAGFFVAGFSAAFAPVEAACR